MTTGSAQLVLAFAHRPTLDAEDFWVAPSNADAVSWIDRWRAWTHPVLVLHGPPGCGKTQGAAWLARGLDRRLAIVMLSKLISKWVGETAARFLIAVDEAMDKCFE